MDDTTKVEEQTETEDEDEDVLGTQSSYEASNIVDGLDDVGVADDEWEDEDEDDQIEGEPAREGNG